MNDNKLYNKDSIESLDALTFTRLRPGVYAGDTTYATQLLVEIVSNAVDEFRLGHGNRIEVTIDKDIVTVMANGKEMDNVHIKMKDSYVLELHIDRTDALLFGLDNGDYIDLE